MKEGPPQPEQEQEAEIAAIKECLQNGRVVAMDEKVTMPSVMEWKRKFEQLSQTSEKPVTLLINSSGGDAQVMRALDSAIAKSETPVYSLATGKAASAAFFALYMGQKIYATPDSIIRPHEGIANPALARVAQRRILKITEDSAEKTSSYFAKKIGQRTGKDPEAIRVLMVENRPMTAQEAKDQGLIDGIFPMSKEEVQKLVKKQ